MAIRHTPLLLLLALSFASIANSADYECVYTIYLRTGSIFKAGTDSKIGAVLYTADGNGVRIADLEAWAGLMGPGYNYYERGNLDIFSGRGPCPAAPFCKLNLTSDGAGDHHGWYCNYFEITATGPHATCSQQLFTVEQWLALDASPYQLYAVRDSCPKSSLGARAGKIVDVLPAALSLAAV